ncbi:MAG: hypothetical protein B7Z45_07260, partial [Azorhizobium sp. 12-66-6]
FGTQADVARRLKLDRAVVSNWVKSGYVPARWAMEIEAATGGAVPALEILNEANHRRPIRVKSRGEDENLFESVTSRSHTMNAFLPAKRIQSFHPPQRSRARVMALLKAMADATQDQFDAPSAVGPEPGLAEAISRLRRAARPGTLVFLVSDFHDFDPAAARELARLSLQCQITNVLVFDVLEAAAPRGGAYPFSDGTAVARVEAESNRVRAAYARRFAERHAALSDLSRQRGMSFVTLATGQDPADILHPERVRRAARASAVGPGGAAA